MNASSRQSLLQGFSFVAALMALGWALFFSQPAEACQCASKPPEPDAAFKQASLVVFGKVGKVSSGAFEFIVDATFKGTKRKSFEVKNEGTDCAYPLKAGAVALAYLREQNGQFRVNQCDGQRLVLGEQAKIESKRWNVADTKNAGKIGTPRRGRITAADIDFESGNDTSYEESPSVDMGMGGLAARGMGGLAARGMGGVNRGGLAARGMGGVNQGVVGSHIAFEPPAYIPESRERYANTPNNPIVQAKEQPVSTFSIDVDTGSYSNVRRFLNQGQLPPKDAVRVEELINYFSYQYPHANKEHPFGVSTELAPCPWNNQHQLLKIAIAAEDVNAKPMPPANLVFLVDISGSMASQDKLPLLQSSLLLLVDQLRAVDRVSLVTYAGSVGVVLEPTPGNERGKIRTAISQLGAGGSTNGAGGIQLAYDMARRGLMKEGINRVLLATDGDFNVGVSDTQSLKQMIEQQRKTGVSLSTLGFGTGNYNDEMMEQIADVGNGNYSYIDSLQEGQKVLVEQMRSTLQTVAKDVKIQVEFNPAQVLEYRLLGYENRMLKREDFNNDAIDAGEVGAGATVTALYEVTPVGAKPSVDPLRYGKETNEASTAVSGNTANELAFVRVRYKAPEGTTSRLMELPVAKSSAKAKFSEASSDFRFATAVAAFGQMLRGSLPVDYENVADWASKARGNDESGNRSEFVKLVRLTKSLGPAQASLGE